MKIIIKNIINKISFRVKNFLFTTLGRKKIKGKYIFKNNIGIIGAFTINSFFTYHLRPRYEKDYLVQNTNTKHDDIAILIQGPLQEQNNFTLESIKIYKKIFPNILIVLSGWEGDNFDSIKKLKFKNLLFVISKPPIYGGELNINFQIKSVNEGLKLIKKFKKIKYVLKTRTDCRFYNPNSFLYLKNMIINFPIKKNNFLEKRILFSSVATCKFRVYGATDITQFATVNDMINYWSVPYYEDGLSDLLTNIKKPVIKGTPILSEIYLFAHFIHRCQINLDWSLKHWWGLLKEYFLVFDSHSLDFFWDKYDKNSEMRFLTTYSENYPRSMCFNDWLKIYHNNYSEFLKINHQEKWIYKNNKFIQISV